VNIADLVSEAARRDPERPALISRGATISYGELDDRVAAPAGALARLGVRPGDRVALLAGNVPEFVSTFFGVVRMGAVACPLNVMLTPEELGYILADAGVGVLVAEPSSVAAALAVRDRVSGLDTILLTGDPPAPAGTAALQDVVSDLQSAPPATERVDEAALAVIAYTAGTTAAPKGAVLTHGNLLANLEQMSSVPALALQPDHVLLIPLLLFHI